MQPFTAEDGCPAFRATAQLDDSQIGQTFRWGVSVGTPERPDVWGIASEINDADFKRTQSHLHASRRQSDRTLLLHAFAPARGQQARLERADGHTFRRLGAERAQCRAGSRRGGWRALGGAAGRVYRHHLARRLHRQRRQRRQRDDPDAPRRRRHLVDGFGGCARTREFRRVRPHPLHVPHHQGRRQRRLPHRPLLPLPDRQRRNRPRDVQHELERALSETSTDRRAARWSSIPSG